MKLKMKYVEEVEKCFEELNINSGTNNNKAEFQFVYLILPDQN